ncbi:MAG: hypothetical protein HYX47_03975 [Burkholderiales bacterium]|nr:hypothetical protein [Burkholderiales bacterium]
MDTWQVAIVSSLLTFIASLSVAYLSYRQWKVNRSSENRKAFSAERVAKHRELWGLVEDLHVSIRTNLPSKQELTSLDQTLNSFRLRNSLYLSAAVLSASNSYFNALRDYYLLLIEIGTVEDLQRFETTQALPAGATDAWERLGTHQESFEKRREELIQLIRQELNADAP